MRANRRFLTHFRGVTDVLKVETADNPGRFQESSLYRLSRAGLVELTKRDVGREGRAAPGARTQPWGQPARNVRPPP